MRWADSRPRCSSSSSSSAAAATWLAGTFLSKSTDSLDTRFGLGEALGGLILLAITGSLPEIAITASAALSGHLDLAVGNLIGGVAIQTLVLVILDFAAGPRRPLSFMVGSLVPVIEALMVIVVLVDRARRCCAPELDQSLRREPDLVRGCDPLGGGRVDREPRAHEPRLGGRGARGDARVAATTASRIRRASIPTRRRARRR